MSDCRDFHALEMISQASTPGRRRIRVTALLGFSARDDGARLRRFYQVRGFAAFIRWLHKSTLSPELTKEIHRVALERDETVRSFILKVLKQQGIAIADGDLLDRRKMSSR